MDPTIPTPPQEMPWQVIVALTATVGLLARGLLQLLSKLADIIVKRQQPSESAGNLALLESGNRHINSQIKSLSEDVRDMKRDVAETLRMHQDPNTLFSTVKVIEKLDNMVANQGKFEQVHGEYMARLGAIEKSLDRIEKQSGGG